ncbi:MAG: hypothetical protein WBJ21_13725 [Burkholderiaceae bacterium]|jgi:hypothetical protein
MQSMHTTAQATFYQPRQTVSGPAYSPWFKLLATLTTLALAGYGASVVLRFPILDYGFGVQMLLLLAAILLGLSYYGFLHSTVTVDDYGITQTWLINRQVAWSDVRSAKMIGIPLAGWLFPPRLVVRTGSSYHTFNGGTEALLTEFAKISLAFQMKK